MPNTLANPMIRGLSQIADAYDGLLCDVWGVIHNGVEANRGTCEALSRYRAETGGSVVLITNAPRPNPPIREQLAQLGVPDDAYDRVVTSGDVTRALLAEGPSQVLHIGPGRDLTLFEGLDLVRVDEAAADIIVCTGLYDDETEAPDDYRAQFERLISRGLVLICANPDLVVDRGHKLIWCAGALARLYDELGGETRIVGKPHDPIYQVARAELADLRGGPVDKARILAIGDGLPTDIKGAVDQGLDALFVTAGIHAADFGPAEMPDPAKVSARIETEGLRIRAALPRLVW